MKLKVIAGAKEGVEIPLKKNKFVIGRASDCTLRTGSDAISRHHCAVLRNDLGGVTVRDLGSRNGTLINGEKIEKETPLVDGDELQVGPLRFLAVAPPDLRRDKKPAVKSVAEAVQRAAESMDTSAGDEDISRWLLGPEPVSEPASARETQTFRMDDTHAMRKPAHETAGPEQGPKQGPKRGDDGAGNETAGEPEAGAETVSVEDLAGGPGGSDITGKKSGKAKPGKLPPVPTKPQAKDSREAAADILRSMARRR